MFKFLFGGKSTPDVKAENNRERFARLVSELNEMIDTLPEKPKVTFDPATGHVVPETPEQFADEALALPAPEAEVKADAPQEADALSEAEAIAAEEKTPAAPLPNPTPEAPTKSRTNSAG